MDLMEKQADLQKEAHKILEQLQLIEILSKYGKPEIIGSLSLGLMIWRDIDIEVENNNLTKEELGELIKNITLNTECRIDFTIIYQQKQKTTILIVDECFFPRSGQRTAFAVKLC